MSSSSSRRRSGSKCQIRDKIDATLLSSCEPEIQELLRQVDGLLDSKRSEWESRVAGLKKQLQRRDGELCALRAALQRKSIEVERLQAKFEDADTQQEEQMSSYEVQLTTLKTELSRLSRKHEKLQTKKEHQMDGIDRERQKVSEDYRFANQELQHLRKAFEELHVKSLLWDKEKTSLEKAAEQAVAESEAMRSRCVYLEECNATYQRDLERYKRLQLNSEQTHEVYIAQLEAKVKLNQQESDNKQDSMSSYNMNRMLH
ncbi:centrosomal protein of 63 kDa-like [Corticium candelabrum]|uniref:centrosomal protein of 63 kDa-like n=1 Tax=Corticium candelabrum TaxID=121492 RepID=UPI002E263388|nr:centrosomal protein of 63 kDa-like [Corticium candelabrum]